MTILQFPLMIDNLLVLEYYEKQGLQRFGSFFVKKNQITFWVILWVTKKNILLSLRGKTIRILTNDTLHKINLGVSNNEKGQNVCLYACYIYSWIVSSTLLQLSIIMIYYKRNTLHRRFSNKYSSFRPSYIHKVN